MIAVVAFTVGALLGAAVALNAAADLQRGLDAFFESCDQSLHALEDM